MVRELVSEVVGLSPYEKRLLDMLKTGGASAEKRMYKFAKKRLGTHKRALKKRDQVKDIYGAMRAKQATRGDIHDEAKSYTGSICLLEELAHSCATDVVLWVSHLPLVDS